MPISDWRYEDYTETPTVVEPGNDYSFTEANYGYVQSLGFRGVELEDEQRYSLSEGRAESLAQTIVLAHGVGGAVQVGRRIEVQNLSSDVEGLQVTFNGSYEAGIRGALFAEARAELNLLIMTDSGPQFPTEQDSAVLDETELVDRTVNNPPVRVFRGDYSDHSNTLTLDDSYMNDGDVFRIAIGTQTLCSAYVEFEATSDVHDESKVVDGYSDFSSLDLNWVYSN